MVPERSVEQGRRVSIILSIIDNGITIRDDVYQALEAILSKSAREGMDVLGAESQANGMRLLEELPFVRMIVEYPQFSQEDLNGFDALAFCDPNCGLDQLLVNFKSSYAGVRCFKDSSSYNNIIKKGLNMIVINSNIERDDEKIKADILREIEQLTN